MGAALWTITIITLILSVTAIFLQVTSPKQIDFQQCTIVSTTSGDAPARTSCNEVCNNKKCIIGLSKFSEAITITNGTFPELNSQESLVSCSETVGYGQVQDAFKIENYATSCVCCS